MDKEYRNQVVKVRFTQKEKEEIMDFCQQHNVRASACFAQLILNYIRKDNAK